MSDDGLTQVPPSGASASSPGAEHPHVGVVQPPRRKWWIIALPIVAALAAFGIVAGRSGSEGVEVPEGWSEEVKADAAAIQVLVDDNERFMEELLAEDWTEDHWVEYVENMLANAEPEFLQLQEELCPNPVQAHREIWGRTPRFVLSTYGYLVSVDFDTLRPDPDWRVDDYGGRAHDIPASGRTYVVRATHRSLGDVTGFLDPDTTYSETYENQMAVTEGTQDLRFNVQDGRAYWFDHISFDATCW